MEEQEAVKNYLKATVKKEFLPEDEKEIISGYFKNLAKRRWSKDTRTKEEKSEFYRNLVNKRWQKKVK